MEKPNKKTAYLLIIFFVFLSLAAIVLAEVYFTISLNSPENNTVTSDTTPTSNYIVTGSEECYSCRLLMCYPNETFATFNSSGDLVNQTDCTLQCNDTTHTKVCLAGSGCSGSVACPSGQVCGDGTGCFDCSCDGTGYETHNVGGDTVYVDCNADKCWTPTASSTYTWGGYGTDEPTDSCTGIANRPACNYCDNLDYGGFTDWTLPTLTVLADLCNSTSCPSTCFNGDGYSGYYWSSTEYDGYTAYFVRFDNCDQSIDFKDYSYYVRCVRG